MKLSESTEKLPELKTFADRLKHLRMLTGLGQEEFGQRCRVGKSYISRLESGGRANPSEEFITACAVNFGIKAEWLKDGIGDLPKVVQTTQATGARGHQSKFHLDELSEENLGQALEDMTARLQDKALSPEQRAKALDNIRLITDEFRQRLESSAREMTTETRAKLIVAGVLPEAQQADAESETSQTEPSKTDKIGVPKVPSPSNQGQPRTPPKPAPKSPGK
jgi:transcriptional regulator with XRE-family HTH domain